MALGNRLVQQVDITASTDGLERSLGTLINKASELVKTLGATGQDLKGVQGLSRQLGIVLKQAELIGSTLDAVGSKNRDELLKGLNPAMLGRKAEQLAIIGGNLNDITRASSVLESRLAKVTTQFGKLAEAGKLPTSLQLDKKLRLEEARRSLQQIERDINKLGSSTGGKSNPQLTQLRKDIEAAYKGLTEAARNGNKINFQPQIQGLQTLIGQYKQLNVEQNKQVRMATEAGNRARSELVKIASLTDAQRTRGIERASSGFSYAGIQPDDARKAQAEQRVNTLLANRLRLIGLITQANAAGTSNASAERLVTAYKKLEQQLAADVKLIAELNKATASLPTNKLDEIFNLRFGQDGGFAFAKLAAGSALVYSSVFAVIGALQQAISYTIEFEKSLKQLQAISGATDQQLVRMTASINEVARSSTYSTLEIAKAATVIAQAGYSAAETGEVLRSAIQLSTASGTDPASAVETLTSTLGSFRLQAEDSSRVVDILITALNRTKLSIEQVQAGIQYAGATAKENNISFEELTTVMASLANAGIRSGSTIGTGIRQLLVDLKTPSEDFKEELKGLGLTIADVDVQTVGFAGAVKKLTDAGFTGAQAYRSFETRAAAAFLAFRNQIDVYDQLAVSIAKGGAAAEAESKAMDSFGAQGQRLLNVLGDLAIVIGQPLLDAFKTLFSVLSSVLAPLADFLKFIGSLTSQIPLASEAIRIIGGALIGSMFGPIGAVTGALIGLLSALGKSSGALDELRTKMSDADAAYTSQTVKIGQVDDAISNLIKRKALLVDGSAELQVETLNLANTFKDMSIDIDSASKSYNVLLENMVRYGAEQRKLAGQKAEDVILTSRDLLNQRRRDLKDFSPAPAARQGLINRAEFSSGQISSYNNLYQQGINSNSYNDVRAARAAFYEIYNRGGSQSVALKRVVDELTKRLEIISEIQSLEGQIAIAERNAGYARSSTTPNALKFETGNLGAISRGTDALAGVKSGKDDDSVASLALKELNQRIAVAEDALSKTKEGTGQYKFIMGEIIKLQGTRSEIESEIRRKLDDERKANRDRRDSRFTAGYTPKGPEVLGYLAEEFGVASSDPKGLNGRTYGQQAAIAARYKGVATPGTSAHEISQGNRALDIKIPQGITPDMLKEYLQDVLGLSDVRVITKQHGSGPHWHLQWRAAVSKHVAKAYKEEQDDVEDYLKKAAQSKTAGIEASIATILKQGRGGFDFPEDLRTKLGTQTKALMEATLAQFDTENPAKGLGGIALKTRDLARSAKENEIKEKIKGFQTELERLILDFAIKKFDNSIQEIENDLKNNIYGAQSGVRQAANDNATAGNRVNARRFGDAGSQYILRQRQEGAALVSDKSKLSSMEMADLARRESIGDLKDAYNDLTPDQQQGEIGLQYLKKIEAAEQDLTEAMRARYELMDDIASREKEVASLPLIERIKGATTAWAEQSGVMDTLEDHLANAVVPALEMVSGALANAFEQVITGQKSIAGALASILSSIGRFITQLIAKALALAAIKWFLKLIGLELKDSPLGPVIQKIPEPTKNFTGGMGGGSGYIDRGVSNRDSVHTMVAKDEYIVRGQAVRSIGKNTMDAINRDGAKALAGMGASPLLLNSGGRQEMNIYVVKPDSQPSMGPNDVLLTIADDILQNGKTKQLIRRVAQGG